MLLVLLVFLLDEPSGLRLELANGNFLQCRSRCDRPCQALVSYMWLDGVGVQIRLDDGHRLLNVDVRAYIGVSALRMGL